MHNIQKTKSEIFACLPQRIMRFLENMPSNIWDTLEEIRINKCGPIILECNDGTRCINSSGNAVNDFSRPYICDKKAVDEIVHICTAFSPYAYEKYLSEGYVTVKGGHRIGICGSAIIAQNKIRGFKNISAVNIRIARCIDYFGINIARLINTKQCCLNTAVVSPPKCGKTTLLRNLARFIASGSDMRRVCIADERGEICAMNEGISQFDIGTNSCVIDGCPKINAIEIALRTMSPEVIICDEIYTENEANTLRRAAYGGVSVIYAIHGKSFDEIRKLQQFTQLTDITDCCVELSSRNGAGTIENIVMKDNGGECYA